MPANSARDWRGRVYAVQGDAVFIEGAEADALPLTDPSQPTFLELPRIDLEDGTPLRVAAFRVWRRHVRAWVEAGGVLELPARSPTRLITWMTVVGGLSIAAIIAGLTLAFLGAPPAQVRVEPSIPQVLAWAAAACIPLWVGLQSLFAAVRAWRCRRGSFLQVTRHGVRTRPSDQLAPHETLVDVEHHRWMRVTRLVPADGGPDTWVPDERGLIRLDAFLACLSEPACERFERRL